MVVKEATTAMVVTRDLGDDVRSAMVVIFYDKLGKGRVRSWGGREAAECEMIRNW